MENKMADKMENWIRERKEMLTASDVAAVLGVDPRHGPLAVYEQKITGWSMRDTAWLKFGRDVEGAIGNLYEHETMRSVSDLGAYHISRHPDIPWLGATLDRVVEVDAKGRGALELKHVGDFSRKDQWVDDPPLNYQIQLQIQMACAGLTWGSLAGMFPGYQLGYRDFSFDAEMFQNIVPVLEKFWHRVKTKNPPPADVLPNTLDVVKRIYSAEDGETVDLDCQDLVDEWETEKSTVSVSTKRKKELEILIRDKMQNATFGRLSDKTFLTLKTTNKKGYTAVHKPTSYRVLRIKKIK